MRGAAWLGEAVWEPAGSVALESRGIQILGSDRCSIESGFLTCWLWGLANSCSLSELEFLYPAERGQKLINERIQLDLYSYIGSASYML